MGLWITLLSIPGFPKIDHSGIDARIVLEQINSAQKATSNRAWTLDPRTVVLTSRVQSHAFLPSELSEQVLIQGSLIQFLFVHQFTFGLQILLEADFFAEFILL